MTLGAISLSVPALLWAVAIASAGASALNGMALFLANLCHEPPGDHGA